MSDDNDDVGYKKPPKHTRFKPGQSGNPKGRRKGSKNAQAIVEKALLGRVPVMRRGRRVYVPYLEVYLAQIKIDAAQGDPKARLLVLTILKGSGLLNETAPNDERKVGLIVLPAPATDSKAWYEKNKHRTLEENEFSHLFKRKEGSDE